MENRLLRILFAGVASAVVCAVCLAPVPRARAQTAAGVPDQAADAGPEPVAVIPIAGLIDDGLYHSIRRRSREAIRAGAKFLVYEIDTYGGLVKSADSICEYLILDIDEDVHTVAYVPTKAISAGAMISVSCEDIIMRESTTLGDSAPVVMGGELEGVEREKQESFIRAIFSRAAEANGYPEPLLKAMVSRDIEVYRVRNRQTGEQAFFEGDQLPQDEEAWDLEGKVLIDSDDQILTLTASRAAEYGVARAVVEDLEGALDWLEQRYDVDFARPPLVLETNWSEELVRKIQNPAVVGILVMVIMLGIYMELSTPGLGLPGLVAVIGLVILVGSKYLIGMANWVEIAIFVVGFILLLVEIFVIPGFGIAGFSGIVLMIVGLFGMLIRNAPDEVPWPNNPLAWRDLFNGLAALSGGFIGFVILAMLLSRLLPRLPLLRGLILGPVRADSGELTAPSGARPKTAASPRVGDVGVAVGPLRPVGLGRFNGEVVDVVAEGEFVARGTRVEILQIRGNRVVVRPVQGEMA